MSEDIVEQRAFKALEKEFETYVKRLRAEWLVRNRPESARRNVLEVMNSRQRADVQGCIAQWDRYITPIAEKWWRERGYEVHWLEDNSKPACYSKLENV